MDLVQLSLEANPLFTNRASLNTNKTDCLGKYFCESRIWGFIYLFLLTENWHVAGNQRVILNFWKWVTSVIWKVWQRQISRFPDSLVCMFQTLARMSRSNRRSTKAGEERGTQREPRKGKKHQTRCQEFLPRSVCLCGWAISPQSQRLLKHELSFAFQQTPKLIMWSGKQTCLGLS